MLERAFVDIKIRNIKVLVDLRSVYIYRYKVTAVVISANNSVSLQLWQTIKKDILNQVSI